MYCLIIISKRVALQIYAEGDSKEKKKVVTLNRTGK
jgi:hypothetical protein